MLSSFIEYIENHNLFSSEETVLVGVSGGVDSVVLADLMSRGGFAFGVAHCNFHLREDESDRDEQFVKDLAAKYDKQYYKADFDTLGYARQDGISVEMAARELRYNWFREICLRYHYDKIAVAHNRDDSIETFFLNLIRGTGLRGLTGIKPENGKVVRPLLDFPRKDIEQYCQKRGLLYRDDSSNRNINFMRNKVRHLLLPILEECNPSFRTTMIKNMKHLNGASVIYYQEIAQAWERVAVRVGDNYHLSISELKILKPLSEFIFEFLKPFQFKSGVIDDIIRSMDGVSGKQFFSPSHRVVHNRNEFIITPLSRNEASCYYLEKGVPLISEPIKIRVSVKHVEGELEIPGSPDIAYIDYDKIQFPLLIRRWEKGEYFKPLGMSGYKKVSDFFVDCKMSIPEKESTWILSNDGQIVWVIGRRLDDRYKVTGATGRVLILEVI